MEGNVSPGDKCDVMVAVKSKGSETMDSYKNCAHPEAAATGTDDAVLSTHLQIKVKTECDIDIVHIKKEQCVSDAEYAGDVSHSAGELIVKTEEEDCIGNFHSDTVEDRKCRIRENNVSMRLGLRSANRKASDFVKNKCQIWEENVERNTEIPAPQTNSVVSSTQAQTIKMEPYSMDNSTESGAFASFCNGELHLKSEEIDLGCDVVEYSPNFGEYSMTSTITEASDVPNCAKQTADTTLRYNCNKQTLDTCSESDENQCGIIEKNTQTNKIETDDTSRVDAAKSESFSDGKLRLNLEEIRLKCDMVKYSPNLSSHTDEDEADDDYKLFKKNNTCQICHRNFFKYSVFKQHMSTHSIKKAHTCNICDKKFSRKTDLKYHMLTHTGKRPHKCKICKKEFLQKKKLNLHMFTHTGDKPHTCNICDKKFSLKHNLKGHMVTHTKDRERPHKCKICEKTFHSKKILNDHMRLHTGNKPHTCNICNKKFNGKWHLNHHILTHTGERPHSCAVCKKKFALKNSLVRHELIHTGQKPHKCTTCEKSFVHKSALNRHLLIHVDRKSHVYNVYGKKVQTLNKHKSMPVEKPYKCNVCETKFIVKHHLSQHILVHTGEKPHTCTVCQKKFSQKGTLTRHQLTHTVQKLYKCTFCKKYFNDKKSLNLHLLKHSNKKQRQTQISKTV